MKAQMEPGWLVSLMVRWSKRSLAVETGALGYPGKAAGFSEKTTGGWNHSVPCDFCANDFADLEVCLSELRSHHEGQYVSIMMHYKPWTVRALEEAGYPFGNSTYYKRLHAAHSWMAGRMDQMIERAA